MAQSDKEGDEYIVYLNKGNARGDTKAKGLYDSESGTIKLLKKTRIPAIITASCPTSVAKLHKSLLKDKIIVLNGNSQYKFLKSFTLSANAASQLALGRSANRGHWRDSTGNKNLDELDSEQERTSKYKKYFDKIKKRGLVFPLEIKDLEKFEKMNRVSITVMTIDN